MTDKTNKSTIVASQTKQPRAALAYEEACERYVAWCERVSAKEGAVLLGAPTPNRRLSQVEGSTWHLRNVCGQLATVGWNGRVWRARE